MGLEPRFLRVWRSPEAGAPPEGPQGPRYAGCVYAHQVRGLCQGGWGSGQQRRQEREQRDSGAHGRGAARGHPGPLQALLGLLGALPEPSSAPSRRVPPPGRAPRDHHRGAAAWNPEGRGWAGLRPGEACGRRESTEVRSGAWVAECGRGQGQGGGRGWGLGGRGLGGLGKLEGCPSGKLLHGAPFPAYGDDSPAPPAV